MTHIAVDEGYGTKKEFLKYVFNELDDVRYLEKIYDSHEKGFNYHVKVFEIDYKTCEMIAGDEIISNLGVIEGRQPAYMGNFMASLGKKVKISIL